MDDGGKKRGAPFAWKRAALLVLTVLVVIGGTYGSGSTYSWFLFAENTDIPVLAGKVNYEPKSNANGSYGSFIPDTDELVDDSYIYPGKQLIEKKDGSLNVLKLENLSTVESNVRVRVSADIVLKWGEPEATSMAAVCWDSDDGAFSQLGLEVTDGAVKKKVPLLDLTFGSGGYNWKLTALPVEEGASEWELVPSGQTAAVPAAPKGGSDRYDTLTSVQVISALKTEADEMLFTNVYSGSRLFLTVEYLAKQHDSMEWNVFYQNRFSM